MWARCVGTSKKNKTTQNDTQPIVHMLDYSNQLLTEFPKLSRKEYKNTTDINFDSNCFVSIPNELTLMPNLRRISFQENNLESVSSIICKLNMLEEIDLSKNELNDVCDEISYCTNLKKLDLSCNVLQVIREEITFLRNLKILIFNDTNLSEIPETISRLKELLVLEARDNTILILPSELGELTKLKRIDLGCNEITNIPKSINNLKHLEELYLDTNSLITIPNEIGGCSMLQALDLSMNAISLLPEELGNLVHLTELNVSNNQLVSLPNSIGNLTELRILRLGDNLLESLPNTIVDLINLEDVYLKNNYISELPGEMDRLVSLSILYVDNNLLKYLPDNLCGCKNLKILSLNSNNLEQLPQNIGDLKSLSILDVGNNKLEYLPYSFSQLKLNAFWLCPSQMRPHISLQYMYHPTDGLVITCYLLPQSITKTVNDSDYINDSNDTVVISSNHTSKDTSDTISSLTYITDPKPIKSDNLVYDTEPKEPTNNDTQEIRIISNVFSDGSETETVDSFSSAQKYMSISSSRSSHSEEHEQYIDEFMSVSQEMDIPPSLNHPINLSNNIDATDHNDTEYNAKDLTVVQLPLKNVGDIVITRDSTDELTFIDYVNATYPNIHRGDIVTKINSVPIKLLSRDKINTMICGAIEAKSMLEVTLKKPTNKIEHNKISSDNKFPIDFETRVVHIQSIELTDFGALPVYFGGGNDEQILPFGNIQSPVFVSFVDMYLIKASSNIYEDDRVIEVNNKPLGDELKDSVSMTQFFFKNRHRITSLTLRNDPPAEFFKRIVVQKIDHHFGFSIQGGYYYNGAIRPNYISDIQPDCLVINGNQLKLSMWIVEVNGIFVLYRRHSEIADIISNIPNNLIMIVFDVEERSKRLHLPGILSTIPCTLEIINKYDTFESYSN